MEVPQEAEACHIGDGVDMVVPAERRSGFIEGGHGLYGRVHRFLRRLPHPAGAENDAHAQRLGQNERITGLGLVVGVGSLGIHHAGDREAVLHTVICNRVPPGQDAPGLDDLLRAAAHDLA